MPKESAVSCPPCPQCDATETAHLPLTSEVGGEALCHCLACGYVWRAVIPPADA